MLMKIIFNGNDLMIAPSLFDWNWMMEFDERLWVLVYFDLNLNRIWNVGKLVKMQKAKVLKWLNSCNQRAIYSLFCCLYARFSLESVGSPLLKVLENRRNYQIIKSNSTCVLWYLLVTFTANLIKAINNKPSSVWIYWNFDCLGLTRVYYVKINN